MTKWKELENEKKKVVLTDFNHLTTNPFLPFATYASGTVVMYD